MFFLYFCSGFLKDYVINRMIMAQVKTIIYAFATAILLTTTSCQGRSSVPADDNNQHVTTTHLTSANPQTMETQVNMERGAVLERVRNIYRLVKSEYAMRGGSYDNELFDKAFCSKSWNTLLMAVHCKEHQTGTLFFEVNPWSMARYSGVMVSFDEFEVDKIDLSGDKKRASVTFTVYEDDTYTPARIDLVCEKGNWMIDNFYNLKYGLNVRDCMWEYIAHDII